MCGGVEEAAWSGGVMQVFVVVVSWPIGVVAGGHAKDWKGSEKEPAVWQYVMCWAVPAVKGTKMYA